MTTKDEALQQLADGYIDGKPVTHKLFRAVKRLLAEQESEPLTVQQGWKLVPVEPTSPMLLKADGLTCIDFKALGEEGAFSFDELTAIYRAMIAAAPEAPAVQPLTDVKHLSTACMRAIFNKTTQNGGDIVLSKYDFARAVIAEFCRINGIGALKD